MKSRVKILLVFISGLLVGSLITFVVIGRINQRQFADNYATGVINQAFLGTELHAGKTEEVAKLIETELPDYVLTIQKNKWLQSTPRAQTALRAVKDFYQMNSLPMPQEIAGILNSLPPEH